MKQEALPTARLEARLPHDVMARLKRAAEIQGRTLTDFVVAAADEAACRAIQELRSSAFRSRANAKSPRRSSTRRRRRPLFSKPPNDTANCSAWRDSGPLSLRSALGMTAPRFVAVTTLSHAQVSPLGAAGNS